MILRNSYERPRQKFLETESLFVTVLVVSHPYSKVKFFSVEEVIGKIPSTARE